MPAELQDLRFVRSADVYKNGLLAGQLARTGQGGVRFSYRADYLAAGTRLSRCRCRCPRQRWKPRRRAARLLCRFCFLRVTGSRC